jgi:predicted small lipoprotein YifL
MRTLAAALLLGGLATGCGKKGPPLAPLYLVPSAVGEVSARRVEDRVRLRFALPAKNENGPGIDLDRVDIYAVTVAPGTVTPPNRELLTKPYLAGQIAVKPPAVEGAPSDAADTRPSPGDPVTFVEQLTPTVVTPPARKPVAAAAMPAATLPVSTDPQTGLPVTPLAPKPDLPPIGQSTTDPVRIYVIRGVARNGRSGPPSVRVQVPLGPLPDAPRALSARNLENAVALDWLPALATVGARLPAYNVYRPDGPDDPLNRSPLETAAYEHGGAAPGEKVCFAARTIERTGAVPVESALSDPACVTPADVFPPATPQGLAAVTTPGAVQLVWDPNSEPDFAGYLVLRAEGADETLHPLTPEPIRDTVYRDASVTAGVRYAYAIVAVDSATPPNRSKPSERVEAVAR